MGALGGVGAGQLAEVQDVPGSCRAGAEGEARITSLPGQEAGEWTGGPGPGSLFRAGSDAEGNKAGTCGGAGGRALAVAAVTTHGGSSTFPWW